MKIESPIDYDYSEIGLRANQYRIPNSRLRRRRGFLYTEHQGPLKPQSTYFEQMYKEVKKKTYVNLFIRKLKQATILNNNINHQLCQSQQQKSSWVRTLRLNQTVEIGYTILQIVQTLIASIAASLTIAFPCIQNSQTISILSLITSIFCLISIISRLVCKSSIDVKNQNSSYDYLWEAVTKSIDMHMLIDCLIMVIYFIDFAIYEGALSYLKILIIVRLGTIRNKITNLQILLISNCFRQQYWELVKVFLFNFLFAHFIAVVLILMANQPDNWLVTKKLISNIWYQQYIWSYYWATTIMLTVGFGDIVPTNSQEALIMIFIESLSCIVLAYNINSVGEIIKKITSYQSEKISDFKTFTQMQGKENLSEDVKHKITNYITQSAELKRNFNIEQQKVLLKKLPKSFFEQFKKQSSIHIFKQLPFFRNLNFDKLGQLALRVEKRLTHPQQIILESGSIPDVYIVNNGQITFSLSRIGKACHGKQVQSFRVKQKQFRLLSLYFFIGKQINYDVKCKNHAIVYSINRKQLQSILSTNCSSYQYYCMIKDKDRYNPNDWEMQICDHCGNQIRHTIFQCPQLHYVPIKELVISKVLTKNPEKIGRLIKRPKRNRKYRIKVNALKNKVEVNQASNVFNALTIVKGPVKKARKGVCINGAVLAKDSPDFSDDLDLMLINGWQNQDSQPKKKKQVNVEHFDDMFREVEEKLTNKIMKTAYLGLLDNDVQFQIDAAHDYASYFHKDNPILLSKKYKKKTPKKVTQHQMSSFD